MVEAVVTVVVEVGKCLATPVGRQFMYLYNYNSNFNNLDEEVGQLKTARDQIKGKVEAAENNVEQIRQPVKEWQDKVESIIDEADKLIEKRANNQCFKGFCPNLMTRYKHSKEALRIVAHIARLLTEEKYFKDFEEFETRRSNLDEVLNALMDAKVGMVGVYGMGGIGKTMLAREVGKIAGEGKLFEKVIFIEVTDHPDIKKIQDDIANNLGLQFKSETERANKLYERLKKGEKILIILDNIWECLDWQKVGIPVGVDRGGCKLLLTARDVRVLSSMGSEENIRMGTLNEDEAWRLFKKTIAGDFIEKGELKSLAEEVCKKCGGLPIAIVTVAKALSNWRDPSDWKAALQQFERPSPENFEGDLRQAYLSIELSYKFLRGEELKKTFLLCSLMGHEASILDLLKYAVGLNMLESPIQRARNTLCAFIHKLEDACLLLKCDSRESFSMHDFVREVAISIANRDDHVFSVRNVTDQWEWPSRDEQKNFTKIFIRDSSTSELPEGLKCPKLESFFMNTKASHYRLMRDGSEVVKIPQKFFTEMTKLKVLDLTEVQLVSLGMSLHLLKDLQTLCLDFCKFKDVAIIGELKRLEILSLRGSMVDELPREIAQLTKLRLLDLSYCEQLKVIAPNVIASLSRLEELYMSGCFVKWEIEVHNVKRSNASLEELKQLSQLTTLELDIEDYKILPQGLFKKELKMYKISIGAGSSAFGGPYISGDREQSMSIKSFSFEEQSNFRTLRTLKLKLNSTIRLEELQGFNNVEFLCLDKLEGVQNVLYELNKEGLSQLKHLRVHNNSNLLSIVDTRKCIPHNACPAFPLLESLILFNLIKLETICFGQPKETSFQNLKFIEVQACNDLNHLFSFSNIAESLPQLQGINVNDCRNMKEIFAIEIEDDVSNNEILAIESEINLCQLRFLTLESLPSLASFCSQVKTRSTSQLREMESMALFNEKVILPNLEVLDLEEVNIEKIWDNQLLTSMSSSFQTLTHLTIEHCKKLKYVFPCSMVENIKQLQHLEICNCEVLKEIVEKGEGADQAIIKFEFPKVTSLILQHLPELTDFYPGTHFLEWPILKELMVWNCDKLQLLTSQHKVVFPKLEVLNIEKVNIEKICDNQLLISMSSSSQTLTRLIIEGCENLKYVFPFSMVKNFKQLQQLEICNCEVLKEIVEKGEGTDQTIIKFEFPKVTSLRLEGLPELTAFYLGIHISEWPMLKKLKVRDCKKLHIFTSDYKVVFPNLEVLILEKVNIEKIWDNQLSTSSSCKNLTSLTINGCEKLKYVFPSSMVESFEKLQYLEICNCKLLKEIVVRGGVDEGIVKFEFPQVVFPNLEVLILEKVNIEKIWDNQLSTSSSCKNLTSLTINGCEKLKYVFPSSMVESFEKLQYLEICNCKLLKEIVVRGGVDEGIVEFKFPQVTSLKFQDLPEFTAFYPGIHTLEWPMLKKLVWDCEKLQIFTSGYKVVSSSLKALDLVVYL